MGKCNIQRVFSFLLQDVIVHLGPFQSHWKTNICNWKTDSTLKKYIKKASKQNFGAMTQGLFGKAQVKSSFKSKFEFLSMDPF